MAKSAASYRNQAKALWKTFSKIQRVLGVRDGELAEMLCLSIKDFTRLRHEQRELSTSKIFSLADILHVSVENIWKDEIDYRALVESFHGNQAHIPERYDHAAFSKRRTAVTLVGFSEAAWGTTFANLTLRHFQIHPAALFRPDKMINIHFLTDFCAYLKRQGVAQNRFYEMGRFSVASNRGSALDQAIQKEKNARGVYERVFEELVNVYYDKNWNYGIRQLSNDHAVASIEPRQEVLAALGAGNMGSHLLCLFKAGVTASLLGYKGLTDAKVTHPKCRHKGDSECLYDIDFSEANFIQERRLSGLRQQYPVKHRLLF